MNMLETMDVKSQTLMKYKSNAEITAQSIQFRRNLVIIV